MLWVMNDDLRRLKRYDSRSAPTPVWQNICLARHQVGSSLLAILDNASMDGGVCGIWGKLAGGLQWLMLLGRQQSK